MSRDMPRSLTITNGEVIGPDGAIYRDVVVNSRRSTLLLRAGRGRSAETVLLDESVTGIRYVSHQRWEVDTSQGTFLVVDKGCGCG
jgi:hypothetical protein